MTVPWPLTPSARCATRYSHGGSLRPSPTGHPSPELEPAHAPAQAARTDGLVFSTGQHHEKEAKAHAHEARQRQGVLTTCPCCGQDIQRKYAFDHLRGELSIGDKLIKLPRSEADIFHTLERKLNRPVRRDAIIASLYGAHEPATPENTIAVLVSRLRKRLEDTPFTIAAPRGRVIESTLTLTYRDC